MSDSNKPVWGSAVRQDNQMVADERVISILPKNRSSEQRVTVKTHNTRRGNVPQRFIDVREFWYKHGQTEEPIPTSKGTMLHREHISKLIIALISEMDPEEFDSEQIGKLETEIARIRKGR